MALLPTMALAAPARLAAGRHLSQQRLAAAWQAGDRHQVGWLTVTQDGKSLRVLDAIDVPTRAHGLLTDGEGRLIAIARRPGDWLLRWSPGQSPQWQWMPPGRSLNGHAIASPDGSTLLTTETDSEDGSGLLGVRDARSLALISEWPTHGRDPHQLVWDRLAPNRVLVANGGIETRPETGRVKHRLAGMDSSLVRLDAGGGRLQGQWRLNDARLSLRHLAWSGMHLGIALQAEHDDLAMRAAAPVLAVFDGARLRPAAPTRSLAGYGGDIAAVDTGFAVGCPRAGGVAWFDRDGILQDFTPVSEACALVGDGGGAWVGGYPMAAYRSNDRTTVETQLPAIRLDNHWIAGAMR